MHKKNLAKLSGYSLVLMAILAVFSFGFALPKMYNPGQFEFAQSNLLANLQLCQSMLVGILIVLLLDLLVSYTLYLYFKSDNAKLALLSCILRIIYSIIFGIATWYLVKNCEQPNRTNLTIIENYQSFQNFWSVGLIIFGVHLLIIGVLMKLHKFIPNILWYLTLIAGVSYMLVHVLKITFPQWSALNTWLNAILALPITFGELGLAVWLILKGGKTK